MDCVSKFKHIDLDLAKLVYSAAKQIPKGRVSTYLDIAKALGDPIAARAVGEMLAQNPTPIKVPCHRIVYSTGQVGWYGGKGKGAQRKIELLSSEGVEIKEGKVVDFGDLRYSDFHIPPSLALLREEQERMQDRVKQFNDFGEVRQVAGLDVSYLGNIAFCAMAAYDWSTGKKEEEMTSSCEVKFPYIPTYLSFREIPALQPLIKERKGLVYMIDGQGVLHPRGMGIASQIGVSFDIPTIGAAKSLLVGKLKDEDAARSPIIFEGEEKGYMIRRGKASYISVGHKVTLETAVEICERFMLDGIPEPLRMAHMLANQLRKREKK